jgi:hypothetical protein
MREEGSKTEFEKFRNYQTFIILDSGEDISTAY